MWVVLRRVGARMCGLQARLTASYVLVTLAVVVVVEVIVVGYQTPQLVNDNGLQGPVITTAGSYAQQYHDGAIPPDQVLGDPGEQVRPGHAQLAPGGREVVVPAVSGPLGDHDAITAVVLIGSGGMIIASSAPSRYPQGHPAAALLPAAAADTIAQGRFKNFGSGSTPYGRVTWAVAGLVDASASAQSQWDAPITVYVQAPQSSGLVNPVEAWRRLRQLSDASALLLWPSYVLLGAIVPAGALFGLLTSRRLVRRVRRLERATLAVAEGDYSVALPNSGRDEVGRLEANFTTMAGQLGSALAAERQRATIDARADERARIAREIHDAISQHLFSLRMIAGGLRRADPGQAQYQAIERIAEDAIDDMRVLLHEPRPGVPASAGLVPALHGVCDAYRSRLGVEVDTDLRDVAVPPAVEHALLRITQEAFTNAVRHGNAQRLAVRAIEDEGQVELTVRDTGTGFDPSTPHAGSGLKHIRDRVAELGGTAQITSAPGHGAAVTVRIPLP